MWWSDFGPTPWTFFGLPAIIFFVLICAAVMFVVMRMMHRHHGAPMWGGMMSCCGGIVSQNVDTRSTSNRASSSHTTPSLAFDEYRAETLRRLEQEQGEFQDFLDHLRKAKDKAEFDQFMAERWTRTVRT